MPVEIVQFCWKYNLERLQNLPELEGSEAKLRMAGDKPYVTDNSNYIVDLYFQTPIKDAHAAAEAISKLTGALNQGSPHEPQEIPQLRMARDKPYMTNNLSYNVDLNFYKPNKDAHAAA